MADDENNNAPLVHAVAVSDIEDNRMLAQTSFRSDSSWGSKKKSGFVELMRKPIKIKCNHISYGCLILTFILFVGVFVLVKTVFPELEPETVSTDITSTTEPEPFVVENQTMTTTTTTIQPSSSPLPSPSPSPSSSTQQIQELLLYSTSYKQVSEGTCESNEMLSIYDRDACIEAANSLEYQIEWGPHGGYEDVVDGCSIRFGAHLFLNSQEGTCNTDVNVGLWTYTGCQCTEGMPCFCAEEKPVKILYQHIPNTYCKYYEQGGSDKDCASGDSFVDVWEKCLKDGSDKCMGVMWNSCEGPTSDTSVNGAWSLMTAGQDVGDANNPTDTCGGKNQALGHWDVFIVV
eukprot:CAMPEP_0178962512 /NCGR_PEP_ID=MMETSP0789-20121207/14409_1 /TAXON_ID=3005 /ORGANISM="Rhizosolenia setigera, Strain CCMP 1694" /LENGTH=345 /DNA_ID=CAMNT_0020646677 /DNA_START=60 /DNA_END=1097 /DNA_ORIENTATION=+